MNISIYLSRKSIVVLSVLLMILFVGLLNENYNHLELLFGRNYQGLYLVVISYIIMNINIEKVRKSTYLGYKSK